MQSPGLQTVVQIASAMDAAAVIQGEEQNRLLTAQQGQVLQYMKQKLPTHSELAQVGVAVLWFLCHGAN